jgi:GTP cyclohydrolase FolE2
VTPRDVQAMLDERTVAVNEVGIEELRYALSITNGQGAERVTVPTTTPPTRARIGPSQQDVGHER